MCVRGFGEVTKNVQQLNMNQVDNQNTQWTFHFDIIQFLSSLVCIYTGFPVYRNTGITHLFICAVTVLWKLYVK